MKVKVIGLAKTDWYEGDEYEIHGIKKDGVYDVVTIYPEIEALVILNEDRRNVMVYNDEVEVYEE